MSKWIAVEERLPDEGDRVLVAFSTGPDADMWGMAIMYRYHQWCWRGYGWTLDDHRFDGEEDATCVTHWQPLPWEGGKP